MIGFDRPVKPKWIYDLLNLVEDGVKSTTYNSPFEDIAVELVGKEGKRKVRTVIFRSFIYSFQEKKGVVLDNYLIELSKRKSLEYMTPIYLMKLIFDYEVNQKFVKYLTNIFDANKDFSTNILAKQFIKEFGDRDIAKRSLRSFLKTLVNFNIISVTDISNVYQFHPKLEISDEQFADIIALYGSSYIKSKHINLDILEKELFHFYNFPNLFDIAIAFNNKRWEFIRGSNRNLLLLK